MKKTIKILIILNIFLIPFICETQYLMYFNILYQLLQFSSLIYLIMKLKGSRRSYLFALVFSTILLGIQSQQLIENHHFPRFIWTFWEGEVNIITQLCFNNMKYYAEKRDWKFTALNSKSFEQSLSENTLQLFQNIKKKGGYKTSKLADLIRCFILFEKGGIWLDASTFLTQDMSWLENIDKDLIAYNRISKYPQVICYTYNGINGGNKTVIFDKQLNKEIVIMPGLQNWAIISKPKSKFLTDVIKLYKVNALDKKQTQTQIISHYVNDGYQYRYQADPYFLFGNFHLQTVLQMKQKEIDKNPKNFQTKYAVQYYQMWLIKGQETAILFSWLHDSLRLTSFFQKLFYSLDQKQANQMKAVKLTKFPRNEVNLFIQFSPYLICSKIIPLFPKSSYIYNYTLSFQQNEPQINYFKRLHENPQQICQQLISSRKIYIYLGLFSLILFMICFLINFIVDKIGIKMNQYRNQNPSQQYNMVAQQD